MKLSLSQKSELEEALKKASSSNCELCVEEVLSIVSKVLERKKFGHIHVDDIPKDMLNIEDNHVFNALLRLFIRHMKRTEPDFYLEEADIYTDTLMFRKFEQFCLKKSLTWELSINKDNPLLIARIESMFIDFKKRYGYNVRNSTRYYDEIIRKLWLKKHSLETRKIMLNFNTAYFIVKNLFKWLKRKAVKENWYKERVFEHLKWTMEIVLRELPNPNINKVILALLHDIIEDIPWITFESIEKMFPGIWKDLIEWIKELTKKDRKNFLTKKEKSEVQLIEEKLETKEEKKEEMWKNERYKELVKKGKKERNKIYFWNLKDLQKDKRKKDILYVKFADRIHNLRTLKWTPTAEIVKKILETEHYFLNVASSEYVMTEWKCNAYYLMLKEIKKLMKLPWVKEVYNKEKENDPFYDDMD